MKIKKILISIILFIIIFIIYIINVNKKIYVISLGDSLIEGINPYNNITYNINDYLKEYLEKNNLLEKYILNPLDYTKSTAQMTMDVRNSLYLEKNNIKNYLKSSLTKSNIVILSLGHNELNVILEQSNNKDEQINYLINDVEKFIKEIKKYVKEKILIMNYYNINNNSYQKYINIINEKLDKVAKLNNLCVVDISKIHLENYTVKKIYTLNTKGYEKISREIINKIENIVTNKTCKM